jgi:hypothetical protein
LASGSARAATRGAAGELAGRSVCAGCAEKFKRAVGTADFFFQRGGVRHGCRRRA